MRERVQHGTTGVETAGMAGLEELQAMWKVTSNQPLSVVVPTAKEECQKTLTDPRHKMELQEF